MSAMGLLLVSVSSNCTPKWPIPEIVINGSTTTPQARSYFMFLLERVHIWVHNRLCIAPGARYSLTPGIYVELISRENALKACSCTVMHDQDTRVHYKTLYSNAWPGYQPHRPANHIMLACKVMCNSYWNAARVIQQVELLITSNLHSEWLPG